jgi:FtsZ-binding cell division protein ZapB
VFTVEDFIKYNLACEIYDGNKEIYGYRLDFLDLMQSTVEELTAEVNSLRIECRRQAEQEEADRVYEKAEEEYSNWMNSAHEDRAIRDRYEDLAEAAEY